ncbi:uncharacterized protein LOC123554042 [Mercenaria mercenaria]|uniref:uncharacterized protein LOC123554042 n=1 Tax=Mercenaria mercenaria TaxID=6596 RepID=UPI00234F015E|nr:uncharacterized protein LOC123554042 [Mercenaria mercenaria]XP_045199843.2 uncharacterized protein LOC123554042 [Mercenaria mercenaria]XP_045199852.2 uncharacterized protein LOC123554042 [Mercenaria mercenaria]XP_045199861.2 uncharacterized protein LOC123554042 [Mercenaria mercenaria]
MSWYNQMMKSQELARERNRREERRQQGEKYGPQFVAKYHLAALDKEKKIIEKELERIRKGIHRPPKLDDHVHNKANHILTVPSAHFRESKHHNQTINPEYSKEEDHLYDAILFLQNNPSALVPILSAHAQSDAYLETLERITPRLTNDAPPNTSFVPKYLKEHASKSEKADLVNKYTALLHRHSPILRRNSPLASRKKIDSPVTHRDSPLLHDATPNELSIEKLSDRDVVDAKRDSNDGSATQRSAFLTEQPNECQPEAPVPSTTPRARHPISIAKLADDGMASARENVSRRLSSSQNDANSNAQSVDRFPPSDESQTTSDDKKSRLKAVVMFPSVDPEVYNPDGTLRTCLNMPDFDTRYEEAKKARYCRTKYTLDREKELSVQEIFEKPNARQSPDFSKGGAGESFGRDLPSRKSELI